MILVVWLVYLRVPGGFLKLLALLFKEYSKENSWNRDLINKNFADALRVNEQLDGLAVKFIVRILIGLLCLKIVKYI